MKKEKRITKKQAATNVICAYLASEKKLSYLFDLNKIRDGNEEILYYHVKVLSKIFNNVLKEMEESKGEWIMENKSLTWMEIRDKLRKPIWDNKQRQWRVVDGYKETIDDKRVSFTDYSEFIVFNEGRFYLEEIEESKGE